MRSTYVTGFQLALRAALAAGLAIALAQLFRLQFPLYAMISAVVVTDLDPSQTRKLGWPRLAGTILGGVLGAVICAMLRPVPWEMAVGIFLAMLLSSLLHLHGAARVAGYVCGIVLFDYNDHPWLYALYRTIETALGIGTAVLVSLVPKLIRINPPELRD